MIRVIAIDDEEPALEELNYVLNKNENVDIVDTFSDPLEALMKVKELKLDAVFLDIEMPEINGFSVAKEIIKLDSNISIIFITAFNQYAVEAFEVNALDYIMKPVSEERINLALNKICSKHVLENKYDGGIIKKISSAQKTLKKNLEKVVIWKDDEVILLKPQQVYYFTIENGEIIAITEEGRFKTKDSLDNWENKLGEYNFFRTHRSFLVNLDKIQKMSPWFNNTYVLYLEDTPNEIPLSRNRLKEFKNIIGI
ncbi:LytR/AlgR family response regulator transcription factor [Oceanirhabdus seepicola]|uniref:Stage 0 sporulation protein A homolog n=1 Tax=Oceanirhabdus seepicola TaxID=2828781 RepID=A0A9J6P0N5_9CLOT|nr:LytTR family DNA-binding domain-containing protein [Oceanirhabdus seepicola]MCM1989948.1 response regulator transcription factor [Oceanirhabdus seepicola]